MLHKFHIPVLGLGFSIDTPLKVAKYGISSVVSVVDDDLIERMREFHCLQNDVLYHPIAKTEPDARAQRITAYLNLLNELINIQFDGLLRQQFTGANDIDQYFNLLPGSSPIKQGYELMNEYPTGESKQIFGRILKTRMQKGAIDVNIMAKVDKLNFDTNGDYTGDENSDALSALRAFAMSDLDSSVVLSAGMNPRLYSYIETFGDFFPDKNEHLKKRIILKVSDYRSAFIQAKFLAKKGLWVSEFRIESGLNCGGHAFATGGLLLGPILEEFKLKREEMVAELFGMYQLVLNEKGYYTETIPAQRISVQGGIGTAKENDFLIEHYQLDATGWGSPFLLVPEVTNVDDETLMQMAGATQDDFYLSNSSPLGILFNNFKNSSAEQQRLQRIEQGRPGSPCTKKYLCTNTEFTEQPICTASRKYQALKIFELQAAAINDDDYQVKYNAITEKVCLCEGLCASVYIKDGLLKPKESSAVTICPGPNLAYFKNIYSLEQMVKHIYGDVDLLNNTNRPNMFINELNLYIDYLKKDIATYVQTLNEKKGKYLIKFKDQLQQGINYYKQLIPKLTNETQAYIESTYRELMLSEQQLLLLDL